MKKYDYILIDADNTILDFTKCEKNALIETGKKFDIKITDAIIEWYHQTNIKYWKLFEKKLISFETLKSERFDIMFEKFGFKNISNSDFNKVFKINLANQNFLMDNALEILNYLKNLNKKIIVITNGTKEIQIKRFSTSPAKNFIDDMIVSSDIGFCKPDIKFYECVFKKYPNINSNNTIAIGDSITADITGGHNANLDTIFFNLENESCNFATHTIFDLIEIKKIINN